QFNATCEGVRPILWAIESNFFANPRSSSEIAQSGRSKRPFPLSDALYLPVRRPAASGAHAVTPRPRALAIGSNSRSGVRDLRLYGSWRLMNCVHPRTSAKVLARAIIQAGVSETPM